jgi:uncharacterized membrane protein YccC
MRTHTIRLLLPILGLGLITLPGLRAQDAENTTSTNAASPGGSCQGGWKHHHGEFANLTEAERQELKAAMEQIKGNPQLQSAREAVKQAMENLRQTRNQLLLQADPNIQPILDKLHASEPQRAPQGTGGEPSPSPEAN